MIPREIKREHVVQAIDEIKRGDVPNARNSTKFDLVYSGMVFPPKYVLTIAGRYATGSELDLHDFSGGEEANKYLSSLGFEIKHKADWSQRECYFAIWAYDQLDQDRSR
jgi:hypothetical protein